MRLCMDDTRHDLPTTTWVAGVDRGLDVLAGREWGRRLSRFMISFSSALSCASHVHQKVISLSSFQLPVRSFSTQLLSCDCVTQTEPQYILVFTQVQCIIEL